MLIFDLNTLSQTNNTTSPGQGLVQGLAQGLAPGPEPGLGLAPGPGQGLGVGSESSSVCDQAVSLLQSLFSRDDIIKVG